SKLVFDRESRICNTGLPINIGRSTDGSEEIIEYAEMHAKIFVQMFRCGGETRRGIMCAHREPAYSNRESRAAGPLVRSERAQDECILLPLYDDLTREEQQSVTAHLQTALDSVKANTVVSSELRG